MPPGKDEFDLRLAAKAADREKAARQQWPTFEERLTELGYGPRAIAHAFRALSGPGTAAEALEVLKAISRPESHPTALSFQVTETRDGPATASGRHDHVRRARRLRDPRQLRNRPAAQLRLSPTSRRDQGRSWQRLPHSRQLFRAHCRRREHRHH